ncbi:DUF1889 family protein [Idiomarina zobellii]|uniref:Uncharacterized protein n=1 Tax=Idiomarina zobellii TaxID=86103 RepID=A0A837NH35_9GAMM|nr:DUF1889 family protein [Idiomarina zobellii]KPD24027.1 hypothetical protein AFK76_05750 [Idiomarina zobellii]SDF82834.1 protein of unknown function [Idiomarina zobellii]
MTPVVEEALKSLTTRVNLSTGLAHPLDSDSAKEMFKILSEHGESLNGNEITTWAAQNGWSNRHASELGDLGEKIGSGGRVQIKNKGRWREDIYEQWQSPQAKS